MECLLHDAAAAVVVAFVVNSCDIFRCDNAPLRLAVSVGQSVGQ